MTGRDVGRWNPGKWRQLDLTQPGFNSLRKREVSGFTEDYKGAVWRDRVHEILRKAELQRFSLHDFATLWSAAYPDDAIEWFKPAQMNLKMNLKWSILQVRNVHFDDATHEICWAPAPWKRWRS